MNKTHFFENKSAVFGLSRDYSPFENDRTIHTYQYKQKENEEQNEKMNRLIAMNESLERQVITLTQKLNSTNKAIPELIEKNNRLEEENEIIKNKYNELDKDRMKNNVLRSKGKTNGISERENLEKEKLNKEIEKLNLHIKEQEELVKNYMKKEENSKKEIEKLTGELNTVKDSKKEEYDSLIKTIKSKDSIIESMQSKYNTDIESIKSEFSKKLQNEIRAKEDLLSQSENDSNNIKVLQKEKEEISNKLSEYLTQEKQMKDEISKLDSEIKAALLGEENTLKTILDLVKAYEKMDVKIIVDLSSKLNINKTDLFELYSESIDWINEIDTNINKK